MENHNREVSPFETIRVHRFYNHSNIWISYPILIWLASSCERIMHQLLRLGIGQGGNNSIQYIVIPSDVLFRGTRKKVFFKRFYMEWINDPTRVESYDSLFLISKSWSAKRANFTFLHADLLLYHQFDKFDQLDRSLNFFKRFIERFFSSGNSFFE